MAPTTGRIVTALAAVSLLAGCAVETGPRPGAKAADRGDRFYADQAEAKARTAPLGQKISWSNPDSGHSGTWVATHDAFDRQTGAYCRDFQTALTIGEATRKGAATACRQPDGSWKAAP